MIRIQDRVELGSSAWVDTAREILKSESAGLGLPTGRSISVCEEYTDAPAHLGLPSNRAAWTIRIEDGRVDISADATSDADVRTTGDYHAALPLAQTCFVDDQAWSRAVRENKHHFGEDAPVTTGEVRDPAINELLSRFHDEMARRTLDNPDLKSRIRAQGLEKNTQELDELGYTIVENAVTDEFANEVREAVLGHVAGFGGDGHGVWWEGEGAEKAELINGQASRLLMRGRIFEEAAQQPHLLTLAEHLCGKLFNFSEALGVVRSTGGSMPVHDDAALIREPFPEYALMGTSVWALEDWDVAAGPTLVLPGSHLKRQHVPGNYTGAPSDYDMKPVVMPKGSIVLWNAALWHAAQTRTSPGVRVTLHNVFSRVFVRSFDLYHEIEPKILGRNAPILTTMCGFDTVYCNNTDDGPFLDGLILSQPHFQS